MTGLDLAVCPACGHGKHLNRDCGVNCTCTARDSVKNDANKIAGWWLVPWRTVSRCVCAAKISKPSRLEDFELFATYIDTGRLVFLEELGRSLMDQLNTDLENPSDWSGAIPALVSIYQYGALKYAPRSYLGIPDASNRYADALCRHMAARLAGAVFDPESRKPHLAHALWGVVTLLELSTT